MTKTNQKKVLDLCLYFKLEKVNPFKDYIQDNRRIFWDYEAVFFKNPNVFQSENIEEDFKTHMIQTLDGQLAESYMSLNKAMREYFETSQKI